MTDAQITSLALSVIIPLSILAYGNSRITFRAEINQLRAEIRSDMAKLDAKLDTIIYMLGCLDTRLSKLEQSINPAG